MPLATPRTWVVGEVVTAALMNAEIRDQVNALRNDNLYARKTADTARTSTTTPTADPHLTVSVAANAVYQVDGWLLYSAPAAADMQARWAIPTGATGAWTGWGIGLGTTAQTTDGYLIRTEGRTDLTQAHTFAGIGSPNLVTGQLRGTLVTAATAGTFAVEWAQGTSDSIATTLYTQSWIRLVRIA